MTEVDEICAEILALFNANDAQQATDVTIELFSDVYNAPDDSLQFALTFLLVGGGERGVPLGSKLSLNEVEQWQLALDALRWAVADMERRRKDI